MTFHSMVFVVFGAILTSSIFVPQKQEPSITDQYFSTSNCFDEKDEPACMGRTVLIKNPLGRKLIVILHCGPRLEDILVRVPKSTTKIVNLDTDLEEGIGTCFILSWSKQ